MLSQESTPTKPVAPPMASSSLGSNLHLHSALWQLGGAAGGSDAIHDEQELSQEEVGVVGVAY